MHVLDPSLRSRNQHSSVSPLPGGGAEELHGPDDEVDGGDDGEDDEPEPEHDVDLLVEDVHAQHAQRVEPLDGARASVLVEDALRDRRICRESGGWSIRIVPSRVELIVSQQQQ